jgi:DNA-binding NarL/FixJ family response regulator
MTEPIIRVIVADDHSVVREGIRHVLEGEPGFAVVAEAPNASDAVRLAEEHQPDVVLMDITMPGASGLQAAARIRRAMPHTRILMLSMHDNPEYVLESIRAGADGYLLKDSAATELRQAIRAVHRGDEYFSAPIAQRLRTTSAHGHGDGAASPLDLLTAREREVLVGIALGRTNKEIAAELGISHRTVETHRESLMRKLGIRTVAGLTKLALETGMVSK